MRILNKSLLIGVGAGVALTLVFLDIWGGRYEQELTLVSRPRLLRSFMRGPENTNPGVSERLPRPWLPQVSGATHDDWQLERLNGEKLKLSQLRGK